MKLFSDSKRDKTDDEKYNEWFRKCDRKMNSKYFVVLWASMENSKDIHYIDRMIDDGYELVGFNSTSFDGSRVIFRKPKEEQL